MGPRALSWAGLVQMGRTRASPGNLTVLVDLEEALAVGGGWHVTWGHRRLCWGTLRSLGASRRRPGPGWCWCAGRRHCPGGGLALHRGQPAPTRGGMPLIGRDSAPLAARRALADGEEALASRGTGP